MYLVSPSGSISINPLEIVTSFGDTISFNCSALGGPDNQYIWTHLTTVVGNDPQLTLSSVTFEDDGEYQCEVFNAAGNDIATSVLNGEFIYFYRNNYICFPVHQYL